MGYIHYCGLDSRFKMIYKLLKNENQEIALNAIKETLIQIYEARGCDCDIKFIDYTIKILISIYVDLKTNQPTAAHNKIRDYHYNINNLFV